ncbi:transmembrane protein, putative [Bodo saltans]|uniref:Transmembrane protein, putative n=1 Tax=Bodo saltans TaxID=75058 RepID=A0A0S4IVV5_BODSA|nr:transmembrane protein, putative [Bodo saltans]|eukprot:CUF62356.1 transmembrane protein, putative [Bodo saltans]
MLLLSIVSVDTDATSVIAAQIEPTSSLTDCSVQLLSMGIRSTGSPLSLAAVYSDGSLIRCSLTVACLNIDTMSSSSLFDFHGSMVNTTMQVTSTVITRSVGVSTILNLTDDTSSVGNQLNILRTHVNVPLIVKVRIASSLSRGILLTCSTVGSGRAPMNAWSFKPTFASLIVVRLSEVCYTASAVVVSGGVECTNTLPWTRTESLRSASQWSVSTSLAGLSSSLAGLNSTKTKPLCSCQAQQLVDSLFLASWDRSINGDDPLNYTVSVVQPSSSSTPLVAASIARQTWYSIDALAVSLTTGHDDDCWHVTNATLRGAPLRMIPQRTTEADMMSMLLSQNPARGSWFPLDSVPYLNTNVQILLGIECAGSALPQQWIPLTIPVPGLSQQLTSKVAVVTQSLQLVSAIASSGGGTSVGRVMALRSVVLCSGEQAATAAGGPLGIVVAAKSCGTDATTSIHRGTILGNLLLVGGSAILLAIFAAFVATSQRRETGDVLRQLSFPSCLLPVWVIVLPSTSMVQLGALMLAVCAADVICIILGVVMVAVPMSASVWLMWWAPAKAHRAVPLSNSTALNSLMRLLRRIFRPLWRWELHRDKAAGTTFSLGASTAQVHEAFSIGPTHPLRYAHSVLHEYRLLWFAVLDVVVLSVVGVLVAISGHGPKSQCTTATILTAALYATQWIICALVQPFTSLFGVGFQMFTLTFTIISAAVQLTL